MLQAVGQHVAIEQVVAQHQAGRRTGQEVAGQNKGLGQALGLGLLNIGQGQADLFSRAQDILETGQILRRGDDADFPDAGQHEH